MKILTVGSDRLLFTPGSAVEGRVKKYASFLERFDSVIFTGPGYTKRDISPTVSVYPTNTFFRVFSLLKACRIGRKLSRPDIVSAQDPFEAGLVAWCVARKHKTKLELQFHTDPFTPHFLKDSSLNIFRVWIMRFLLSRAHHLRVVSESIARSLVTRGVAKEKITVLPIFVSPPETEETSSVSIPSFGYTVLVVSRLTKEKNVSLALSAFAKALPMRPDSGLVIVGDGPERKNLEELTLKLGIQNSVFFAGWQESVYPFYKKAQLYVLTSWYEGFGRTLIEAAYLKIPILSTPVGVAKEVGASLVVSDQFEKKFLNIFSGKEVASPSHLPSGWYVSEQDYLERLEKSWKLCLLK